MSGDNNQHTSEERLEALSGMSRIIRDTIGADEATEREGWRALDANSDRMYFAVGSLEDLADCIIETRIRDIEDEDRADAASL